MGLSKQPGFVSGEEEKEQPGLAGRDMGQEERGEPRDVICGRGSPPSLLSRPVGAAV